ncbi:MAG: tetratricopeptide repeat protein [Acidobacteria bacterium]|nr:tetratricopeptide repeat protein [Acidobacteriota bacterium]
MHTAKQHANMCRQRLPAVVRQSEPTKDLYHLGLSQVAERRFDQAQQTLDSALAENPDADHVLYALCLCHGLRGDLESARRFLERAIELNPKNRSMARTDPDFLEFGRHSPLREMVFGERTQR